MPGAGATFANALRALLRQDPDVILVGEIRDAETAEVATQAALTGHLLLSTLHTNDAPSAVTRLLDLGVAPHLVASTPQAVLAQRLTRRLCGACRGSGCNDCRSTGFAGRSGVYELLVVNDDIRATILGGGDSASVRRAMVASGMPTLAEDGARLVVEGLTTLEKVLRSVPALGR